KGELAGGYQDGNLVAQGGADAGNGHQLAGGYNVGKIAFKLSDSPRRLGIRDAAKAILSLQLQQGSNLVQNGGDFVFVHRRLLVVSCCLLLTKSNPRKGLRGLHYTTYNGQLATDHAQSATQAASS